jgi:hypothetical protein
VFSLFLPACLQFKGKLKGYLPYGKSEYLLQNSYLILEGDLFGAEDTESLFMIYLSEREVIRVSHKANVPISIRFTFKGLQESE